MRVASALTDFEKKGPCMGACKSEGRGLFLCRKCGIYSCAPCQDLEPKTVRLIEGRFGYSCKTCASSDGRGQSVAGGGVMEKEQGGLLDLDAEALSKMVGPDGIMHPEKVIVLLLSVVSMMKEFAATLRDIKGGIASKQSEQGSTWASRTAAGTSTGTQENGTKAVTATTREVMEETKRQESRRLHVIVRGVDQSEEEEGYIRKAFDMEQVATIASIKNPTFDPETYKEGIEQCSRLGKDPTHKQRPILVKFKEGRERMRDSLLTGSQTLSKINLEGGTKWRIQEDLTMEQRNHYTGARAEADSRSGNGVKWMVVGLMSNPRVVMDRRLMESTEKKGPSVVSTTGSQKVPGLFPKDMSKEERKEKMESLVAEIPKDKIQSSKTKKAAERAEDIRREDEEKA
jgi:hypothetical protein